MIPILALLLGTFGVVLVVEKLRGRAEGATGRAGRIALAVFFFMTGISHFVVTEPMAQMVPTAVSAGGDGVGDGGSRDSWSYRTPRPAYVQVVGLVFVGAPGRGFTCEYLRGRESHRPGRAR